MINRDEMLDWALGQESPHHSGSTGASLVVTTIRDVLREEITWLWQKRIPQGKLVVIGGDPGLGKSYLTLDIAARVSLGGPWPDGGVSPKGDVLLISAEDGLSDTIRPRLELLGADVNKVHAISTTLKDDGQDIPLSLSEHLGQLEDAIIQNKALLLILDPILAFTGKKTDTYKSSDVRAVLAPLSAMAERTNCAVVSVLHLNKRSSEGNSIYRLTSSLDFTAAARSVFVVGKHPDDPDHRVLAPVKSNLSAPPKSLAFHFTSDGYFNWTGEVDLDANDVLAMQPHEGQTERDAAKEFLITVLNDGEAEAKNIMSEARECNITARTLNRAKKDLGITACRRGKLGKKGGGVWVWRLPSSDSNS